MPLRLALHVDPRLADAPAHPGHGLEGIPDLAREAERRGADVLWIAERPTQPGALVVAALPCCAAALAGTRRLHVGTGVLPLPLHHPLRVAEEAATLDALSAGRFELGLGLGADRAHAPAFGVPPAERAARFEEALALVRAAFAPGPLARGGPTWDGAGVEVHPKPHRVGGPPLWIGAAAPAAQRRAAAAGAGLFLPAGADPTPYLDAWAPTAEARGEPRLALLLGPEEAGSPAALRARVAALKDWSRVQLDLVAPAPIPGAAAWEAAARFLDTAAGLREELP